jgi:uncharacterized membrane protein YukC
MTQGVPAEQLSDADLRQELRQLNKKHDDIQREGTDAQKSNHASRSAELEAEFARRFPQETRDSGPGAADQG